MFADFSAFCPGSDVNSCRTAASLACRVSASVPESLFSSFSDTTCCLSCACAGPDIPVSVITKATAKACVNALGNMRLMQILLNLSHHWLESSVYEAQPALRAYFYPPCARLGTIFWMRFALEN